MKNIGTVIGELMRNCAGLAVVVGLAGGCVSRPEPAGSPEIRFSTETGVRAAVENDGEGLKTAGFQVWGWRSTGGSENFQVFTGDHVKWVPNSWIYDGTRYWELGTYSFRAIHPAGMNGVDCTPEGISVSAFDAGACGPDAVDLMTAEATVEVDEAFIERKGDPVPLQFRHELARVNVVVKSESSAVTVSQVSLSGVNIRGDFRRAKGTDGAEEATTWTNVVSCPPTDTPFVKNDIELSTAAENGLERDVFGDLLLIPQPDLAAAKLQIAYRYPGETADRVAEISLNNSKIAAFAAGKSYRFTVTLQGGGLVLEVTVNEWTEENTSVSWG